MLQKRCSWPPEQELAVRKAFDQKASSQLSDALYRVRAGQDQGTWIPSEYHAELEEKWKDKNWKEKAKKNSANRKSSDRPLHTGGSITTSEHLKRMVSHCIDECFHLSFNLLLDLGSIY